MTKELDLAQVFKAVSKTLVENQSSLDEADTVNHDHGTNMVNTFKLIEKAVKAKKKMVQPPNNWHMPAKCCAKKHQRLCNALRRWT